MKQITLHWQHGDADGHGSFKEGERIVIGRKTDCALVMPSSDRRIHREHAEVIWKGGNPQLRNLGANAIRLPTRGLALQRGQTAALHTDDTFQLGEVDVFVMVSAGAKKVRMLRCHNCERIQPYRPETMCVQCGFALAGADTVIVDPSQHDA